MKRQRPLESLPSEATIRSVVHGFYAKVRKDDLLAPVFGPRLEGHWDEHLSTMVDFWASVLLSAGRYRGRPLAIHGALGEISPEMWTRWLSLFAEAARENATELVAALFVQRAEQIAAHLSRQLSAGLRRTRGGLNVSIRERPSVPANRDAGRGA